MTDIIIQAYQVLEEIKKSPHYHTINTLNQAIPEQHRDLVEAFQIAKQDYETIMAQGGRHHPDFKETVKRLSMAKTHLHQQDMVKRYLAAEQAFETEINTFLHALAGAVSPHIKTPDKWGIIHKGGSCHVR